jgi:hypothetical protein
MRIRSHNQVRITIEARDNKKRDDAILNKAIQ